MQNALDSKKFLLSLKHWNRADHFHYAIYTFLTIKIKAIKQSIAAELIVSQLIFPKQKFNHSNFLLCDETARNTGAIFALQLAFTTVYLSFIEAHIDSSHINL